MIYIVIALIIVFLVWYFKPTEEQKTKKLMDWANNLPNPNKDSSPWG